METHISKFHTKPEKITYWRNPTKDEIKFGHGATHYRDFDFEICFDKDGFQILKTRATDDNLIYYYTGLEYFTTSKAKLKKLEVI